MKFNFRKIASVLSSAVMVSSTVALAAAATYPAPFIKSGEPNVAIVFGQNAPLDLAAVLNLNADLSSKLVSQSGGGSSGGSTGSSTVIGGDYVKLHTENDEFNLGESMSSFYSTLDDDELSTVLTDGTYENGESDEFDYTQEITLGKIALTHFQDTDFNDEKPAIGFDIPDGTHILNYTLEFDDAADGGNAAFDDLEDSTIQMLGRDYYIVRATATAGQDLKLELLDAANSVTLTKDEPLSVPVGDKTYEVTLVYSHSSNGASFHITGDGVDITTDKMDAGDVKKIADDTYLALKENNAGEGDADIDQAVVSIGTGKITIEGGEEVQINNEDISDIEKYNDATVIANVVNSTAEHLDSITLSWTVGDDVWLAPGTDELVLPGFETIKIAMGAFNVPAKEVTRFEPDGDDKVRLVTEVNDGKVTIPYLYANASGSGFGGIGKDSDENLITTTASTIGLDMDTDSWFIASAVDGDEAESYVFELTDVQNETNVANNKVTLKNVGSGSSSTIKVGDTKDFGIVRLQLNAASEELKTANFTISGGTTASFDRVYTDSGMTIRLPVINITGSGGHDMITFNLTAPAAASTFVVRFFEETESGTIASGNNFNATLGFNGDTDAEVNSVTVTDFETSDSSDKFEGYVNSSLATRTLFDQSGDQDTLEVEYHGEESFADVFVAESGATISGTTDDSDDEDTTTTTTTTVKSLGNIGVSDAEVASVSNKNLIVVGGSCINSVAAELLGVSYPTCGSAWESATGVGAGSFLIQTFARSGSNVATLVAGYNADDTKNAVSKLTTDKSIDLTAGKKFKGNLQSVAMVDVAPAAAE